MPPSRAAEIDSVGRTGEEACEYLYPSSPMSFLFEEGKDNNTHTHTHT